MGAQIGDETEEMGAFLKREKVDYVVACDMTRVEIVSAILSLAYLLDVLCRFA